MTADARRLPRPSKTEMVFDLIRERMGTIAGLLLIGGGLAAVVGLEVSIPRSVRLAGLVGGLTAPIGYVAGSYIRDMLPGPDWYWLVDLDAELRGSGCLARVPWSDWQDLEVTDEDGNVDGTYELHELSPRLYVGRQIDLEEMTVVGTWMGTLSDAELMQAVDAVRECRGQLQERAKRGERIHNQAWSVVRNAVQAEVREVVETFERGALPDDGDALEQAVDDALEEYNMPDPLEDAAQEWEAAAGDGDDLEAQGDGVTDETPDDGPAVGVADVEEAMGDD